MDIFLIVVLALVAGSMQSLVYTLAFIKNDNGWIKSIITVGVITVMFTEAFYFKKNFPNFLSIIFFNSSRLLLFISF